MKNKKKWISIFIFFLLYAGSVIAQENWVVSAEKFSYSRGQTQNAITDATAESMPVEILEKLGNALTRTILPDEDLDRIRYESRKSRLSLYLQLSSAYKKRDAVLLNDYSESELKNKIQSEEKNIKSIQEKIDLNLKELKEAETKAEKKQNEIKKGKLIVNGENGGELNKFSLLFRNIISQDGNLVYSEDIHFYKDDTTSLYVPSEKAKKSGYESYDFEKEIVTAKVNTLITGIISNYGEYMSVTVKAYSYPGGKIIGNITEIGSMQEKELLTTSIARQLIPVLTNAMPVIVNFNFSPTDAGIHLYIDDVIQTEIPENMVIESGIHNIQIVSEGYESIGTNYYFAGNEKYEIDVNLVPQKDGYITVGLMKPLLFDGEIYSNGIAGEKLDEQKTRIKINGQSIMGEFIASDGKTDFYFIPEKLITDGNNILIKPNPMDRSEYIEKRRKWMYGAYSAFIVSLVPSFYTYGNYLNYATMFNNDLSDLETALKWEKAYRISAITSIGLGSFFAFEMFRYFRAANSVLPKKAKPDKKQQKVKIPAQKENGLQNDSETSNQADNPSEDEEEVLNQIETENLSENTTDV